MKQELAKCPLDIPELTISKPTSSDARIRMAVYSAMLLLSSVLWSAGQGTFQNLNFEQTTVPPTPLGQTGSSVDPAAAFPGWTVGGGGGLLYVLYNNLTLGSPAIDFMGPSFPNGVGYTPLQGSYSVLMYYDNPSIVPPPTLSQTAFVPTTAQSINFLIGNGVVGGTGAAVLMNGVNIPLVPISGGRLAGDISAFGGSVAQLTFTISPTRTGDNGIYFDDIRFSSQAIPEPGILSLVGLGVILSRRVKQMAKGKPFSH